MLIKVLSKNNALKTNTQKALRKRHKLHVAGQGASPLACGALGARGAEGGRTPIMPLGLKRTPAGVSKEPPCPASLLPATSSGRRHSWHGQGPAHILLGSSKTVGVACPQEVQEQVGSPSAHPRDAQGFASCLRGLSSPALPPRPWAPSQGTWAAPPRRPGPSRVQDAPPPARRPGGSGSPWPL